MQLRLTACRPYGPGFPVGHLKILRGMFDLSMIVHVLFVNADSYSTVMYIPVS